MTFPINEHDERDRHEKYSGDYPEENKNADKHTYTDERVDRDSHHNSEDEEDHVQPEPREDRPEHAIMDEDNHPRYVRDETHGADVENNHFRQEGNAKGEVDRFQESAERGEEKAAEVDGVRGDGDALHGQDGDDGGERKREGDGPSGGNANEENPEEENEQHPGGFSLFVRNVARHVTEDQLLSLFSKVSFSHNLDAAPYV